MKYLYPQFALIITASLLITSCSTGVKPETPGQTTEISTSQEGEATQQAQMSDNLLKEGKPLDAAMLYLKNASRVEQNLRPTYLMKGAQILLDNGLQDTADNIIHKINPDELNDQQLTQYVYLKIQLAIYARKATASLILLKDLEKRNYQTLITQARLFELYIRSYELSNDLQEAVNYRIQLEPLLNDQTEMTNNEVAIVRVFLSMSPADLQQLIDSESNPAKKAWAEFSQVIKNTKNPFRLASVLTTWKETHPELAISDKLIAMLAPQEQDQPPKINNIALLLPLSGSYKNLGDAVRDGFLTSYYSTEINGSKPSVRVYNTANTQNILDTYQTAVKDGADIVVGPLTKENVTTLATQATHFIPMLALNNLEDQNFYQKNFYQFSLAPESEAKQVAERAWQDGHNRAAVITPDNKWGNRLAQAFKEEWEKLGGTISAEAEYNNRKNDFSRPIKSLLAIDKSKDRERSLAHFLQVKLRFEPRRRQDIDLIFMAALPRQARLIPPQLTFYQAENLPIYTTSNAFSGRINSKNDRDLNGVFIADMPWTLSNSYMASLKKQIYKAWPNMSKQFNRLYAFGSDAYNILYYLNWLRDNSNAQLEGATGRLQMNEQNQVIRQLSWAEFSHGVPKLIAATATPVPVPASAPANNP